MSSQSKVPFFVTIPHSGETVPEEAKWLKGLPEVTLMRDVDRFVDRLYLPSLNSMGVPVVTTQFHRYAGDLNRLVTDVDASTVIGSKNDPGKFNRGFLWAITTLGETLMSYPIEAEVHERLVKKIYEPFHEEVKNQFEFFRRNSKRVFHIDAHSMPSLGTKEHRDPGELRAEIVISDCDGKSCSEDFRNLVIVAYVTAGFKVGYNWPYKGGRVSEVYGKPAIGQESIQVELNRSLYMDEGTKKFIPHKAQATEAKIKTALEYIMKRLPL